MFETQNDDKCLQHSMMTEFHRHVITSVDWLTLVPDQQQQQIHTTTTKQRQLQLTKLTHHVCRQWISYLKVQTPSTDF